MKAASIIYAIVVLHDIDAYKLYYTAGEVIKRSKTNDSGAFLKK